MNILLQEELSKFKEMTQLQKIIWLNRILFLVSMYARDTYQVGTIGLDKPEELRRYNELIHRISGYLLKVSTDSSDVMPEWQFFNMLNESINELNFKTSTLLDGVKELE